ncbi:MAG: exodeoxyribonuclease VII small subunit [Anaerolineales bacterium]
MTDLKFKPLEELSYEDALQELEELVHTLEEGDKDLETTLLYFERGQKLASHCISLLDEAESKVEELMKGENDAA